MLREFESPAYIRIVFFIGMAVVGMLVVVSVFTDSVPVRDQLFSWLQ